MTLQIPQMDFIDTAGLGQWLDRLLQQPHAPWQHVIGYSRDNRQMYGFTIGDGPVKVSLVAGAHADEPAGPMALFNFLAWLSGTSEEAASVRASATFAVFPQVNPDGAEANKAWVTPVVDLEQYLFHVKREGPGEDIEFGYPAMRPENEAVAGFLKSHGPFHLHMSLHGMAMAAGAWFLIGKNKASETRPLQLRLAALAARHGFGLHDIDRNGEKGFTRIARGFCTTPESSAMKAHFLDLGDPDTAARFHLNSMEYVQSLGGNPLVMVSELPIFALDHQWGPAPRPVEDPFIGAPEPGSTIYEQARSLVGQLEAQAFARRFGIVPVPFEVQVRLLMDLVKEAVAFVKDPMTDHPPFTEEVTHDI